MAAEGSGTAEALRDRLGPVVAAITDGLEQANAARETALRACRSVIRSSGSAIRNVHRQDDPAAAMLLAEAASALRTAQDALQPFPDLTHAGFLHDAEKEYAEACCTRALVAGLALPDPDEVGVDPRAWMKGLAEAASELRRHLLDRLRDGELERAEVLLAAMGEVYDALVVIDFPDALTLGLRRTLDALRAVLERSRADVTATVVQHRLWVAIEQARLSESGADSANL